MIIFVAMKYDEEPLGVFTSPAAARTVAARAEEGCGFVYAYKVDALKQPFYSVILDDDGAFAYEDNTIHDESPRFIDNGYPVTASFSEFKSGRRRFSAAVMAKSKKRAIDKARSIRQQMIDEEDPDEVERQRVESVRLHEQRQIDRSKQFFRNDGQRYTAQCNDAGQWYIADEIGTKVSAFMTEEESRALVRA